MNDNTNIIVRPFTYADLADVYAMDSESCNDVFPWVQDLKGENNNYNNCSWGIYIDDKLAGYCTIGYADDVWETIKNHHLYSNNTYLLSDVYMKPEYRHHGYGLKLITETIKGRFIKDNVQPVFLESFHKEIANFYEKTGFEIIPNADDESIGCCCMVYDPNK